MNRVKDLRNSQVPKMSQEKLGHLVGVGRTAVAMWESGKSEPDNATLVKLAEIFGVSADYLLGRTDQKETPTPAGEHRVEKQDLMAAFWGGDKDLSPEDMDAMWNDVENFAAFVAEKKKREKQG